MSEPPRGPLDHTVAAQRIEELLLSTSALRRGHFLFQHGRHGDRSLELPALFQDREATSEIAQEIATQSRQVVQAIGGEIDLVVGSAACATLLAIEIGRHLGVPGLTAEAVRGADGVVRSLLPGEPHAPPRARVLLVDDALTTAGSLQSLLPPLYAAGAHPIAAAVVVRHTAELTSIEAEGRDPIPLIAGITMNLPTYAEGECPLCAAGEPLVRGE